MGFQPFRHWQVSCGSWVWSELPWIQPVPGCGAGGGLVHISIVLYQTSGTAAVCVRYKILTLNQKKTTPTLTRKRFSLQVRSPELKSRKSFQQRKECTAKPSSPNTFAYFLAISLRSRTCARVNQLALTAVKPCRVSARRLLWGCQQRSATAAPGAVMLSWAVLPRRGFGDAVARYLIIFLELVFAISQLRLLVQLSVSGKISASHCSVLTAGNSF